jgi:hypothetical protein
MKQRSMLKKLDHILGFRPAGYILLFGFSSLFLVHLGVLFHWIPAETFWGGRMQNAQQLLQAEIAALAIILLFSVPVLLKLQILRSPKTTGHVGIWIIFSLMLLNAAGNLLAETVAEKWLAVPAVFLAICALRLTRPQ